MDCASTGFMAGGRNGCLRSAATSRATPATLMQSPRFGVRFTSKIVSFRPSAATRSWPACNTAGRSNSPDASSLKPSSRAEHNIPDDSTPRSFACLISIPFGSFAPMSASGAFMPTRTFGAPQTICSSSRPFQTRQTLSFSASGCLVTRLHFADDDIRERRRCRLNGFDFEPDHRERVRQPAHVLARVDPLAQPLQADLHQANCPRKRRSFSKNRRRSLTS